MQTLDWIKWSVATAAAGASMMLTAFAVFDQKDQANQARAAIEKRVDQVENGTQKRLDRIEDKLDRLLASRGRR